MIHDAIVNFNDGYVVCKPAKGTSFSRSRSGMNYLSREKLQ
jgi:hypothetical protein